MNAPDEKTLSMHGWSDKREARIPGRMIRSKAFMDLTNTAKVVLLLFMQRRTWYIQGKGRSSKRIYNNNDLQFSYTEAKKVWGINERTFRDSIKQLIEHGFLRVKERGGTFQGNRKPTIYMLVNDWERYGTPGFIKPEVPLGICYNDSLKRLNEAKRKTFSTEKNLSRQLRNGSAEAQEEAE